MPPYNPIFGHLLIINKIMSKFSKDVHTQYLPDILRRVMPDLGPIYYLAIWPFGPQMIIVTSTRCLYQITQEYSLPKYYALKSFLEPIADGLDIVTMEGDLWKTWRGIFNPGFNTSHLMNLTSSLVEETERFCEILQELSRGRKLFKVKDLTDNLTMDVIRRVILYDFGSVNFCNWADGLTETQISTLKSEAIR